MMFARVRFTLLLLAAGLTAVGCQSAPLTGRKQMLLMPESQEVSMGLTAFNDVTEKEPPSQNTTYIDLVERVGKRIAAVADKPDYKWEFKVIESDQQNAFCLPGGKVAVYEGIIPVCATEAGLAVVMSHEIAHALARHGGERMSQNMAVDGVKQAVSYVMQNQDQIRKDIVMQAYGVSSQYGVLLPYSRKHESEADHIGLILLAKAGYDPREAPRFWTRFGEAKQGQQQLEFMSTHPSDKNRAADLAALVPEAMALFEAAPEKIGLGPNIDPPPAMVATKPEEPVATPTEEVTQPSTTVPGAAPPAAASATTGASPAPVSPFGAFKFPTIPPIFGLKPQQ
ncbi:TPR repeat-containing protein YfgC precursor [Anatilimnocola aggregata]|uniref:TPR repeat-containing protein YfgC n=1 Tax=Anatilimnocola aggregata TaxID=2528021 RepID=A0A517Y7U5_9BACT|nr:M48 family metallopeptidase [Anatilimnocola aggregata]QDU26303.1 TPR repeat-containing protein YfgC precursor [Anatilimnocola aggregata]